MPGTSAEAIQTLQEYCSKRKSIAKFDLKLTFKVIKSHQKSASAEWRGWSLFELCQNLWSVNVQGLLEVLELVFSHIHPAIAILRVQNVCRWGKQQSDMTTAVTASLIASRCCVANGVNNASKHPLHWRIENWEPHKARALVLACTLKCRKPEVRMADCMHFRIEAHNHPWLLPGV